MSKVREDKNLIVGLDIGTSKMFLQASLAAMLRV
jgi:hypothetical protein